MLFVCLLAYLLCCLLSSCLVIFPWSVCFLCSVFHLWFLIVFMCVCESLFVHSSTFCFDLCLCVVFVIVCRLFLLVSHAYLLILDFFNISYVLCSALYCPTAPFLFVAFYCVYCSCVCVTLFVFPTFHLLFSLSHTLFVFPHCQCSNFYVLFTYLFRVLCVCVCYFFLTLTSLVCRLFMLFFQACHIYVCLSNVSVI